VLGTVASASGIAAGSPYAVLALGLLAFAIIAVLVRGDGATRASVAAMGLFALPYAAGMAVVLAADTPDGLTGLARAAIGPVSLVGPALLLLVVAVAGRVAQHRRLIGLAFLAAATTCALTWSTDLVISGVGRTGWGLPFPRAGPLNELHVGQLLLWPAIGVLATRRRRLISARRRWHRRRTGLAAALAALSATDALLAHGIGVYPLGWVPGGAAVLIALNGIIRGDLLQARGFDRGGAWELGLLGGMAALLGAAMLGIDRWHHLDPVVAAVAVTPLLALTQLGVFLVRRRGAAVRSAGSAERELDAFAQQCATVRDDVAVATALAGVLERGAGLTAVALWRIGDDVLVEAGSGRTLPIDRRVRSWLQANPAPIEADDLDGLPLGGLREPIEAFFIALDAGVAVALRDRAELVGLVSAAAPPGGRALAESQRDLLGRAAGLAGRALTFAGLLREAVSQAEVAREVELAGVLQRTRSAGTQHTLVAGWELVGTYEPAPTFGGHWWLARELADGRLLVVMGDVSGAGLSAALVSFTLEGACDTFQRMSGSGIELITLLEGLNRTLLGIGGDRYAVSCFAALVDRDERSVTFANAGHPFPYVRRGAGGLGALVSRGTPLGGGDLVLSAATFELGQADLLIFCSDTLVEVRNPEGERFGDRRLQRVLRASGADGAAPTSRAILDAVRLHAGGRPIGDDLTLLVIGPAPGRPAAPS